ncbi:MAG: hypothetical protein CM1200mP40_20730 [Gammaproteobacteria bacterium]|nr:MAG: hypothetical protein CM1200mP40_20730 [Gammaproteobacteria bacterium]
MSIRKINKPNSEGRLAKENSRIVWPNPPTSPLKLLWLVAPIVLKTHQDNFQEDFLKPLEPGSPS